MSVAGGNSISKVWLRKGEASPTATRVRFYQHFSAFMAMLCEFKAKVVVLEVNDTTHYELVLFFFFFFFFFDIFFFA